MMVDDPRAGPERGNVLANGRDGTARFSGDEDRFDLRLRQVDVGPRRDFREVNRVGRGAAQSRCSQVEHSAGASGGAHAAASEAAATQPKAGFKRQPESDKRPEREGEENVVGRRNSGNAQHRRPLLDHAVPALRGVEPSEGCARSPAGLMAAGIAVQRESEVRPGGRGGGLVADEFLLGRERKALIKVGQPSHFAGRAGGWVVGRIELIVAADGAEQVREALELSLGNGLPARENFWRHEGGQAWGLATAPAAGGEAAFFGGAG